METSNRLDRGREEFRFHRRSTVSAASLFALLFCLPNNLLTVPLLLFSPSTPFLDILLPAVTPALAAFSWPSLPDRRSSTTSDHLGDSCYSP
jgi:hypothetical protein